MKRIIVCADGTWNYRDKVDERTKKRRPTNVTKVARAVQARSRDGIDQVVFYHEGVGTSGVFDKYSGGVLGSGIENNIRELYRSILYNYSDGDELFFFGFSRGAFTVRTLAGFMNKVGLIRKDADYYLPELYAWYESGKGPDSPEWDHAFHNIRDRRECPPIKFVGVWDTVGSLGPPGLLGQISKRILRRNRYEYHDISLNSHIQHAYHALAIDERRQPFTPSLWERPTGFSGTLEQAWFVGMHSNVGGSSTPDGLANEALHWMVEKAEDLGLEVDSAFLHYFTPCFNDPIEDSMTAMYKVLGPYVRPIGKQAAGEEAVHQSALDRRVLTSLEYAPANLNSYLSNSSAVRTCNTTRIPRGKPCADRPHS